jgi:UDP-N-acetylglucosamine:LPS N-acetylglucosamine transferase
MEATGENLARLVGELAADTARRNAMAEAARKIGSLDGAAIIGDSIGTMVGA